MKKIYALLMLLGVMLTTLTMPAYGKSNHEAVVQGSIVGTWKLTNINSILYTQEQAEESAKYWRDQKTYVHFKSDGTFLWITIKNGKVKVERKKWYFKDDILVLGEVDFGCFDCGFTLTRLSDTKMTISIFTEMLTVGNLEFVKIPYSTISKYLK